MQYLKPFQPFPYGVSPLAIGYNYYMQAQTLQRVAHLKHAQLSDQIVDSRPAIALKFWAEAEQAMGRRNEEAAFGVVVPATVDRIELELPTAAVPLTQKPAEPSKLPETIFNYEKSASVATAAVAEYNNHLKLYPSNLFTYVSHIDGLNALHHYSLADAAYLHAMTSTGAERTKWIATAKTEYPAAIVGYERILLKYYTDDNLLEKFLPHVTKEQIDDVPPATLEKATIQIQIAINRGTVDSHYDDRDEYTTYFRRANTRLQSLDEAK
jgi:hypothetical protein